MPAFPGITKETKQIDRKATELAELMRKLYIDKKPAFRCLQFMYYYKVCLPLGIDKDFSYSSSQRIAFGARVLVPLRAKLMLGICMEELKAENYRYKSVVEVLDEAAVLPEELLEMAKWMAWYYHCSVGKALFAMLPSRLQCDVDAEASWIGTDRDIPQDYLILYEALQKQDKLKLSELKQSRPDYPVYRIAEAAQSAGYITLAHRIKHRDKPRKKNFIETTGLDFEENDLPLRQREAWELIKTQPESPFLMADISSLISYSALKGLVKKGIIRIFPKEVQNSGLLREKGSGAKDITLTDEQNQAVKEILEDYGKYRVHLLYGITGSGKTEVYIEIIRKYLEAGSSVIFLIPEIALTPQMLDRFDSHFGENLAVMHSQLTENQRFAEWQKIKSGDCRLVIGARSAVFAPMQNLGLIIVDEEHESSYKQDNVPRYNGRDLAVLRAQKSGAQIILGSATPSLESWHNAQSGKYRLHRLKKRPMNYTLPKVRLINLCDMQNPELISDELAGAIAERLERKEQVILFQNRRGYSSFVQCLKCGKLITCPNCEISMYYHRDREEMQCHYCGHFYPIPRRCPSCNGFSFSYGSPGTQKVEQTLKMLFPSAKLLRMDSDSSRSNLKSMYQRMKRQEIDILLGTQMISKGLDFPGVTLVGIINADISLNIPDFRASERSFQLITQVAGRSGRAEKTGEVIIQTYNPEHYSIQCASRQDFESFALEEMDYRKRLNYPPAFRLARLLYQGIDLGELVQEMDRLKRTFLPPESDDLIILGPSPAPFAKINQLFRYHVILKARTTSQIREAVAYIEKGFQAQKGISKQIDIDPMMLM
jgi:primosomal protein N' (replication factor Y)